MKILLFVALLIAVIITDNKNLKKEESIYGAKPVTSVVEWKVSAPQHFCRGLFQP